MKIIGRIKEQRFLSDCLLSGKPEFLVVYGRRRVGKTYLIREYFNQKFSFYSTGVARMNTRGQLKAFRESLIAYGDTIRTIPADWFEAFSRLRTILERENIFHDPVSNRRVVFLDEVPWMNTARSDFISALDFFWNSWGSAQQDLLLIVCGSATSWIIDHLLADRGGFYNRITHQIHLLPFDLHDCNELLEEQGIILSQRQLIECYMVFGGIPYYLSCLDRRLSLAQNVDILCFHEDGQLHDEYDRMFQSLFRHAERHLAVISALAGKKSGMSRVELISECGLNDGESTTKVLNELEECGFIRKFKAYGRPKTGCYYQIVDPFTLFCLNFMNNQRIQSWLTYINTPGYFAWAGNAFEIVCMNHIRQIKECLGISGVETMEYAWRSRSSTPGAQIDMIIDRKDGVMNLCEIKYSTEPFTIDASYEQNLLHKMNAFRTETGTQKALYLTMITSSGLKHNEYAGTVQNEITAADLMKE